MEGIYPVGPALPHVSLERWRYIWKKCRDVVSGEESVKLAGTEYLPKMARMTEAEYDAYKLRALFYGASHRTIQGLAGAMLRKPPSIYAASDAMSQKLEDLTLNITQTGSDLHAFTRDIVHEILTVGRVGVLVDMPPQGTKLLDPQPYARLYTAEDIINWRMVFVDGVPILEQVVLLEVIFTPGSGGFGVEQTIQYRELVLNDDGTYIQRVWVINPPVDDKEQPTPQLIEEIMPLKRGKPMNRLPFFFCSASHNRPDIERPPLLDLFNVNLSHYRSSADLEHGRHYTALPTPVVSGVDTDTDAPPSLEIGASTAWLLPTGAQAKMLEFNGQGLKHLENALAEKVEIMTKLGARMLEQSQQSRGETAEALRLRQAGDFATMNTMSDCVGNMLTQVVQLMAWWGDVSNKPNDDTIWIELTKDYFESRLTPAMLTALVQAWQMGAMGFRDLYDNMVSGEMIDPAREFDEVKQEVESELNLRNQSKLAAGPGVSARSGTQPNSATMGTSGGGSPGNGQ